MAKVTGFWNTLATGDLEAARRFYTALGFEVADMPVPNGITVKPDPSSQICLFTREAFAETIPGEPCDASRSQEIVQSVSVDAREDVDALIAAAVEAGGRAIGDATGQPFGYAGGFADPDGHVWAVLWFGGVG